MEKEIRKHFAGVESITYYPNGNFYDVVTKNVFTSYQKLKTIVLALGVKDIEVNIVYMTYRISYRIFL